jgi:hypothetical protein
MWARLRAAASRQERTQALDHGGFLWAVGAQLLGGWWILNKVKRTLDWITFSTATSGHGSAGLALPSHLVL